MTDGRATHDPAAAATHMTREELLAQLTKLLPAQFEDVLFRAELPPEYLSASSAPQATRAIEVIRYLELQNRIPELAGAVEQVTAATDGRAGNRPGRSATMKRWGVTVVFVAVLAALLMSFFFGSPLDLRPLRGVASNAGAAFVLGAYRCTADAVSLPNCYVEHSDGGRTVMRFDGDGNGKGGIVNQLSGTIDASGACVRVELTRLFATDGATPTSSRAGVLDLCKQGGGWEGSWVATTRMRFAMAP